MTGGESVCQDTVQGMLHTGQALGGVIVFVMDVQIVLADSIQYFLAQKIVVDERFGGFAGKLHHHACRCVGIHIGVFAGDIIRLDIDDFQKHIACFGFAGNAALVAVGDVFLGDIFAAALH